MLLSAPVKGAPESSPRLFVLFEHKAEKLGHRAFRQLSGYQNSVIDGYFKDHRRIPDILSVLAYQGREPFASKGLERADSGLLAGYRTILGEDFFAKSPLTVRDFMIDFKMPVLDFIRGERVLSALRDADFLCRPGLFLLNNIHSARADAAFIGRFFGLLNDFFKDRENEGLLLGSYEYLLFGYGADSAVLKAAERRAVREGILPEGGLMNIREEIRADARQEGWQEGRQEGHEEVALNLLQKNLEIPFISEVTGLSEQKIHKLKNGKAE